MKFFHNISVGVLIKNPMTVWLKWVFFRFFSQKKFKNLSLGYMSRFNNSSFGEFVTLYANVELNNVFINDFTYISNDTKIQNADIGKFCSIGPHVLIGLGKHPTEKFVSTHPIFYSKRGQSQLTLMNDSIFEEYKKISIGNDVWIGARAIILDGVCIGDGAIIAAGSIVTKNVTPYSVVGGSPAKFIKARFDHDDINYLNNIKWWNWPFNNIFDNWNKFNDIKKMREFFKGE